MKTLSALTRWVRPFSRSRHSAAGHDARDDVEGDQPLLRVGFAIDREGDADAAEQQLGLAPAIVEHVGRHLAEPARQLAIGRAHARRRLPSSRRRRPPSRTPSTQPLRATPDRATCPLPSWGAGACRPQSLNLQASGQGNLRKTSRICRFVGLRWPDCCLYYWANMAGTRGWPDGRPLERASAATLGVRPGRARDASTAMSNAKSEIVTAARAGHRRRDPVRPHQGQEHRLYRRLSHRASAST